jgi:hypothetical protein
VNAASVNALDVMMTGKSLFIIVFKLMSSYLLFLQRVTATRFLKNLIN